MNKHPPATKLAAREKSLASKFVHVRDGATQQDCALFSAESHHT